MDYQWGPPVHVVPIQGSVIVPAGIVCSLPLPNRGICLVTWCVEEAHRLPFIDQIHGLIYISNCYNKNFTVPDSKSSSFLHIRTIFYYNSKITSCVRQETKMQFLLYLLLYFLFK